MELHLIQIGSPAYQKMLEQQFEFFETKLKEMGFRPPDDLVSDWISVSDAMRLLGVKRTKLQEMKNAGDIRFFQNKKKLQFSRKSIAEYQRKHSTL